MDREKIFNEYVSELKKMVIPLENSINSRGGIITNSLFIEDNLTDLIAWCFYPRQSNTDNFIADNLDEKSIILKSLLLTRLDFKEKIMILNESVLLARPQICDNNKDLIDEIVKGLDKVRKLRNLLAHSPLVLSELLKNSSSTDNSIKESFTVNYYRKGKITKHPISSKEIGTAYSVEIGHVFGMKPAGCSVKSATPV